VVTRRGANPTGPERQALEAASVGDRRLVCQGGWTTQRVRTALGDWVRAHTGRDDLEFVFVADAVSAMRRAARDEGEEYDLGDGVKASGPTFDALLAAGPDDAAEIIEKLRRLLDQWTAPPFDLEDLAGRPRCYGFAARSLGLRWRCGNAIDLATQEGDMSAVLAFGGCYDARRTSALSGVPRSTVYDWRRKDVVVPHLDRAREAAIAVERRHTRRRPSVDEGRRHDRRGSPAVIWSASLGGTRWSHEPSTYRKVWLLTTSVASVEIKRPARRP